MSWAKLGSVLAGLALAGVIGAAGKALAQDAPAGQAGANVNPEDCVYRMTLQNALIGNKPLEIHMDRKGGTIHAIFATARGFNSMPHDVDASGLRLEGHRIAGPINVTIHPDPWMPKDGKPVACSYTLDARVENGAVSGSYKGSYGPEACEGAIIGTARNRPQSDHARFRLRFFAPLYRLWAAVGRLTRNDTYALDMTLTFSVDKGRLSGGGFESVVPDYRGYSAIMDRLDLKFDGNSMTGTAAMAIDYGMPVKTPQGEKPVEAYVYAIRGLVIGDTVVGRFDTKVGELEKKDQRFIGSISRHDPPRPSQSIAWLRMHNGMQEGPVMLNLSLTDKGLIHGYAYASRYNHQPHGVDASGLKLEGNRLKGNVRVSIFPDCYRPPEKFDMTYAVDAKVDGFEVRGGFTGNDRGKAVKGVITGEVHAKSSRRPPDVSDLATCRLDLGYSLKGGTKPGHNNSTVRYIFDQGRLRKVEVTNPQDPTVFTARVQGADLKIEGDRLTGSVVFTANSTNIAEGEYTFTFEAIVDGGGVNGFWRGTHNGKDILTKSAKLGGKVTAAGAASRERKRASDVRGRRGRC